MLSGCGRQWQGDAILVRLFTLLTSMLGTLPAPSAAKNRVPGDVLSAWVAEANWDIDARHSIFGRAELVRNDELFPGHSHPLHDQPFRVARFEGGYAYRIPLADKVTLALGGSVATYAKPAALDPYYGKTPVSGTAFAKLTLGTDSLLSSRAVRAAVMRWIRPVAAALCAGLLHACTAPAAIAPVPPAPPAEVRAPVTILIGIDGFRPDYLDRGVTPVLSKLAAEGVRATMRPSFPTKTFPNFYTLVTGKRPDRHGIVANRFEDPSRPGETFTMRSEQPYWWDQGEPIWNAAEKAGIQTAVMFWPGSAIEIGGTYPHDWQAFGMAVNGRQRVDSIIDWLRRPAATRPKLLGLYFDTIDTAGHRHGPDAAETTAAVAEIDALIGRLTSELAGLGQPANLVFVADHGMAAVDESRRIQLDRVAAAGDFRTIEEGPYAAIEPLPGREAALAAALLKPHPHMACWRRADIPAHLHYGRNPRVPSFLCLAEVGWTITTRPASEQLRPGGAHGWDPAAPEMAALFVAHGPDIARGVTLPTFDNIHVAPLMRRLAGIPDADDIDGDPAVLAPVIAR